MGKETCVYKIPKQKRWAWPRTANPLAPKWRHCYYGSLLSVMNVKTVSYFSRPLLHWHSEGTAEKPLSRAWITLPQVKQHHSGVQSWLGPLVSLWHASPTQNSAATCIFLFSFTRLGELLSKTQFINQTLSGV